MLHAQRDERPELIRARQNAILELGYFVGALKRHRVCALVRDELELPSDIHGIVYVTFDGGRTWANVGLRDTRHIGRVRVHPRER